MQKRLKVAVVGATGMVGQRLLTLLAGHPYFEVTSLATSQANCGRSYADAVKNRWHMSGEIPEEFRDIILLDALDVEEVTKDVDFLFCAVSLPKGETRALEEAYARCETPVISNNSACRGISDVPMLIPEINPSHLEVIPHQRERLGSRYGYIVTKPNCSIQSYVPALTPLLPWGITEVAVSTYQAASGAGRALADWEELNGTVIPYIAGEEEKSEQEPKKLWGWVEDGEILPVWEPTISAHCVRVPVADGHLATVSVRFRNKPSEEEILAAWDGFHPLKEMGLPSSPCRLLTYLDAPDRPQPRLDAMTGGGMGIVIGRLRPDTLFDYKFACLSHNTLRGAAGGSVLTAEYLYASGHLLPKAEALA